MIRPSIASKEQVKSIDKTGERQKQKEKQSLNFLDTLVYRRMINKGGATMISLKDIHWVAGFMEGEGHFCLDGNDLGVGATQVQRWPIEKMVGLFGGHVRVQDTQRGSGRKAIHRWELHGDKAAALSMTLYSLMSPKRKEQIERGLKGWKMSLRYTGKRTQCPKGHKYTVKNTLFDRRGHRTCKECRRIQSRTRVRASWGSRFVDEKSQPRLFG